ncbi:MAG: hypothetical protein GEV11_28460, partial [Streptosporangiales bacterium]|nr:hypothetical protein [Streptosporangiales bacterium]
MRRSAVYASVAGVLSCSVAFGAYIALSGPEVTGDPEIAGMDPVQRPSVDDPRAESAPDEGGMDRVRELRERREMRAAMPLPTSTPTPAPVVAAPAPPAPPAAAAPEPTEPPRRDQVAPGPPPADDEPRPVRMRTITYQGARFRVPAHWPVYRLDEDPERCVRFDEHAVYLGVPAEDQQCPVGAVGRTEALHVRPYDAEQYNEAPVRDRLRTGRDARVPDTVAREVHARGAGLLFFATFDTNRALIERILRSVRPIDRPATPEPTPTPTPTLSPALSPTPTISPTPPSTTTPTTPPRTTPTATPSPTPT